MKKEQQTSEGGQNNGKRWLWLFRQRWNGPCPVHDGLYTEDKGDFEIPTDVPDEDETPDEQDTEPIWF